MARKTSKQPASERGPRLGGLTVYLDPVEREHVERFALAEGRSAANAIRVAVRRMFDLGPFNADAPQSATTSA